MKTIFSGYYRPTKEEFDDLWKNCIFVFDASVLLDLYRSTAKTRNVLLSIFEKIKDRIWIPYQAAWEYQENRLDVIAKERELYSELRETLNGLVKSVQQKMHNHAVESAERIKEELEQAIRKIIVIIDQGATDHPDLIASDHIRDKITKLFEGKVGKKLDEKRLATIHQEGPKRYEQKIPPGYKDAEKGGTRQFGDLIIWNEILDQSRSAKRSIIFITSDTKEDWWWKQGQFTVGPRPELVQEMASFSDQRLYMYNVERFLEEADVRLDTKVGTGEVKKAAEEFKEIEQKRELDIVFRDTSESKYSTSHPSEFENYLKRTPSPEWSTVPFAEFLRSIQMILGRSLSPLGIHEVLQILRNKTLMDDLAHVCAECWEMAQFIANAVSSPKSKSTLLSGPPSSP